MTGSSDFFEICCRRFVVNTKTIALCTIGCICVLFMPASFAKKGTSVNISYSGFGFNTSEQLVEDEFPVTLSQVEGQGTFGKTSIAITVEFVYDETVLENCSPGFTIPLAVLDLPDHSWAFTVTAPGNSQIFGMFDGGWMCLTEDRIFYEGETGGVYIGGTGRFEGATGTWTSRFGGMNLDPSIGFRSMTGEIRGTLSRN
jgi:hypothetical protein